MAGFLASYLVPPRYVSTSVMMYADSAPGLDAEHNTLVRQVLGADVSATVLNPGDDAPVFRIDAAQPDAARAQALNQAAIDRLYREVGAMRIEGPVSGKPATGGDNPLERQLAQLEARTAALERRARTTPPADAAQGAEQGAADTPGRAELSVVDTPSRPETPESPNRKVFSAAGFGIGLAVALGSAVRHRRKLPAPEVA